MDNGIGQTGTTENSFSYTMQMAATAVDSQTEWDHGAWKEADVLEVNHFHPASSDHHPKTQAKLLYDAANLYVRFLVNDRYVRAARTQFQDFVANDSCVEFFIKPLDKKGYFNFEINCIGTLLLFYIEDPTRSGMGFEQYSKVPQKQASKIDIHSSLNGPIHAEVSSPLTWELCYNIPIELLDRYTGCGIPAPGTVWQGNFYKCGDETSHPHWAAWNPIGEKLDFHQPDYFGLLLFG